MRSAGIHHITAIAGDPQRNLDFYTETLGLRLVKRTVNFDDPGSYHFYFGDNIGSPGTIITFFPWPGARQGSRGSGQVTTVSFAVPPNAIAFWKERLRANHVIAEEIGGRFGSNTLRFLDPDGMRLELIATHVIPSGVEGSRSGIFKTTSMGSLGAARDDVCCDQLKPHTVGIEKAQSVTAEAPANFLGDHVICTQSLFPKCNRIMWNGEADCGYLPAPTGAWSRSRPGKKGNDRSGAPDVIAKVKMVAPGIVEIYGSFDQTQSERLGVKVEIALRISRDRGDVMDAGAAHGELEGERVAWPENLAMNF